MWLSLTPDPTRLAHVCTNGPTVRSGCVRPHRPGRGPGSCTDVASAPRCHSSRDRASCLTGLVTCCSQLSPTFSTHIGFHAGTSLIRTVPVTEDNVTPQHTAQGTETDPRSLAQLPLACGDVRWLRLVTRCPQACVLGVPALPLWVGFYFPRVSVRSTAGSELAAQHLDVSFQSECVLEACAGGMAQSVRPCRHGWPPPPLRVRPIRASAGFPAPQYEVLGVSEGR